MKKAKSEFARFKDIKRYFNSKVFYKADALFLALFLILLWVFTPFEWSVGAAGTSTKTQEKIMTIMEERTIPQNFFAELFESGNMQSGGYVQSQNAETQMYYYEYGALGRYEEATKSIFRKKSAKTEQPGMLVASSFVSLNEDGTLYYETLGNVGLEKMGEDGIHGTLAWDWKAYVSDSEGYDYKKITSMLEASSAERISLKDGVALSALILENSLIGYKDGTAWFVKDTESSSRLIKSTSTEVTDLDLTFNREGAGYVMVADSEYFLFCDSQGRLGVYSLSESSGTFYTVADTSGNSGKVNAFTYDIKEDGAVRIHAVTDSFYWFADMTGEGVELTNIQSSNYDGAEDVLKFDNKSAKAIAFCDGTVYLFFGKDNYHYYKLR